jgi:acyl-CoA synthetase (AMP-forming)/AMP-acid ligase II/acyl carrier protein
MYFPPILCKSQGFLQRSASAASIGLRLDLTDWPGTENRPSLDNLGCSLDCCGDLEGTIRQPNCPAAASNCDPAWHSATMHCDLIASTMFELLERQAADHGDRTAYTFLDDQDQEISLSYTALDRRARAIAAELQTRLKPGDRALLVYPAGLEFIAAFFGCMYAGVVAVPATYPKPRRPLPRMNRIAADCGARVALTTAQTLDTIDQQQVNDAVGHALEWIATDSIRDEEADAWQRPDADGDDLAFLQYTSGSTSDPKGVMVTHDNLLTNLEAIRQAFGIGEVDSDHIAATGVFWLPAYHDMGLIGGILTPLYVGGRSVLMSPTAFLQRPIRWLRSIDTYQATISGAPNFAYELCVKRTTAEERAGLDLGLWRLAFCGAEPIRAETIEQFTATYAEAGFQASSLFPCYGLAESTLLAAGPDFSQAPTIASFHRQALADHRVIPARADDPREQVQRLVGCGAVIDEHELVIVEPNTLRPASDGVVGEILLHGPSIAKGYWNRPDATAEVFGAHVPGHGGGFLRTGDLGFVHDGELFVTGRVKDVIIIRGRNHYPQDIEQTVDEVHPAILPGAAFAVTVDGAEELVVVHQVDRQSRNEDWSKLAAAVRRAIVANHELDPHAIVFIRQTSLPITSSGKVQRGLCRQQFLDDDLKVVHMWKSPRPKVESASAGNIRNGHRHAARNGQHTNGVADTEVHMSGEGVSWKRNGAQPPSRPTIAPAAPENCTTVAEALRALPVDRAAERIESWLLHWLVDRVGLDPVDVDRTKPFAEFGVDSMTSVELSQELEDEFGVKLTPVVAWNYPTPASLSRYIAEQLCATTSDPASGPHFGSQPGTARQADLQKLLTEVENLSDEEVARLLEEEN